jgi:hypothetical protein
MFVLLLLVVIGLGIAYHQGWLTFDKKADPQGSKTELSVTLDRDRLKEDVKAVRERAGEVTKDIRERVQGATSQETVKGQIKNVDMVKNEVTILLPDQKEMTVAVTPETKIMIGNRAGQLMDLRTGQSVTCTHTQKENQLRCHELKVEA